MADRLQKKVGIVTCSGEELAEGTVSRLAALKVLEKLRPDDTVTICLPLFLAGGEGDRAFAKFYPTITIDGCDKRCAYRGTQKYSNTPAASIVITDLAAEQALGEIEGKSDLNAAGLTAVDLAAEQAAGQVDELLGKHWSRREGAFTQTNPKDEDSHEVTATCSCGSGIPVQLFEIDGRKFEIVALPLLFKTFSGQRKAPSDDTLKEIIAEVRIYNVIEPENETALIDKIDQAYQDYWKDNESKHEQN
ncbi:MAG: putative zinc-binding protein [Anaerolineaceae bacterium]